jgi:hypothetical protein
MKSDLYLRAVLTVIAAALVYLCVILTPVPAVSAQAGQVVGAPVPGVSTGPGEMVIVGWKTADAIPVNVRSEVRVAGRVQTEQLSGAVDRVVVAGWESQATARARGEFVGFGESAKQGLPVSIKQP